MLLKKLILIKVHLAFNIPFAFDLEQRWHCLSKKKILPNFFVVVEIW